MINPYSILDKALFQKNGIEQKTFKESDLKSILENDPKLIELAIEYNQTKSKDTLDRFTHLFSSKISSKAV